MVSKASDCGVDASIKPISHLQNVLIIGFLLLFVVVFASAVSSLSWSIFAVVVLGVVWLLSVFVFVPKHRLSHLTVLPASNAYEEWLRWQLRYFNRGRSHTSSHEVFELWEAELYRVMDLGYCVHLTFNVTHPMPMQKSEVIWQDQLPPDAWRKLKVIARWHNN